MGTKCPVKMVVTTFTDSHMYMYTDTDMCVYIQQSVVLVFVLPLFSFLQENNAIRD